MKDYVLIPGPMLDDVGTLATRQDDAYNYIVS